MSKPRLLDLFCGAGGCSVGYHRGGFDVTGVDLAPQKNYPFRFIQADALAYVAAHGHEYAAISASPPCQRYSRLAFIPGRDREKHPDLVDATRGALVAAGRPYVIENVVGAPLREPFTLCGAMFGLRVYRHRLFEANFFLLVPPHPQHRERVKPVGLGAGKRLAYYTATPGAMVTVAGHLFGREAGAVAMGIDWMTRDELAQAIPPAYTQLIGTQLLRVVQSQQAQAA